MASDHPAQHGAQQQPPAKVANPAQPNAPTAVPPPYAEASAFKPKDGAQKPPAAYPKVMFHPVHGGVTVKDAEEQGYLVPATDWFDSAELADAARTYTEAEAVRVHNQMRKLKELEDARLPVVSNSVQADEAVRHYQAEPL